MKNNHKIHWSNVIVKLNGKTVREIKEWRLAASKSELIGMLKRAEEREDYLLCAEIKKQLDTLE